MTKITNDAQYRDTLIKLLMFDDVNEEDSPEYQELTLSIEDYENSLNIPKDLLVDE